MSDRRKMLVRLLAKEKHQGFACITLRDKDIDFATEKTELEIILKFN